MPDAYPRIYKVFIKREKSVADQDLLSCITASRSLDPGLFVPHNIPWKLDPRGISVPDEAVRVFTGPWCLSLNRYLHDSLRNRYFYTPGSNPKETSVWINMAIGRVTSGEWDHAIAVQGDDSLLIMKTGDDVHLISSDMSRYDMSINTSHLEAVWKFLEYIEYPLPDKVVDFIKDQQSLKREPREYHTRLWTLWITGTMASGDGVTITFNSLILLLTISSWVLLNKDQPFDRYLSNVGFSVTYSRLPLCRLIEVDYLQSRLWLTDAGVRVLGPKPGRIMARFFYIDRKHRRDEGYIGEAKAMSLGLLSIASHVPIINDLCRRVLELTEEVKAAPHKEDHPDELRSWAVGSHETENPDTIYEMASLYCVDPADLFTLRKRCSCWSFCEPIDNTPLLTNIVKRICEIDLS